MTVVDVEGALHVTSVVDHLTARGFLVGHGEKPHGGGWTDAPGQSPFAAYVVVHRVGTQETRNQLMTVRYDEARIAVQCTCVGADAAQVNALYDEVNVVMLDGTLIVPGRRLQKLGFEVGISTTKDPDERPSIWYGGARYRIWTLPE